jgi:DNA-binding CsgD family transcriptional regulator
MSQVSNADLKALLRAVEVLNSGAGMETLAERTLRCLDLLVPSSSMTAFDGFDADSDYSGYYWYSPPGTVPEERVKLLGEIIDQHPHYQTLITTSDISVCRISDGLPLRKFHGTELYNGFYRIFDGDAQLAGALRVSPKSLVTCSVHRPKRDFTDREMEMFSLLMPHLRAAFRNAQEFEKIETERRYLATAVSRGIAVISVDFHLVFINEIAERLLQQYFDDCAANKVPDSLQRYIQMESGKIEGLDYYSPAEPYRLRKENSELLIRLAFDNRTKELILLFEEKIDRSEDAFQCLGLTSRQSEVLSWMSKGKTDAEIAQLCNISRRTVEKHAENLFVKLGVETRTAAVMAAVDRLGT